MDRDECGEQQLCGRGECRNTEGGYECSCQQGYGFDGVTCFDLDEVILSFVAVCSEECCSGLLDTAVFDW